MGPCCLFALVALAWTSNGLVLSQDFSPRQEPSSKTAASSVFFNIGQNYETEWLGFANAVKKPAGISVYGDIYSGALNPDSQNLLSTYAQSNTYVCEISKEHDAYS